MTAVDRDVVGARLATMHDLLGYLAGVEGVTGAELRATVERRLAVERALAQLVDQAVDINSHVAVRVLGRPPRTQRESFELAARAGCLPPDLAERLAPSVVLRDLLVHEYGEIDLDRVAGAVGSAVGDYTAYVRAVSRALLGGDGDPAGPAS